MHGIASRSVDGNAPANTLSCSWPGTGSLCAEEPFACSWVRFITKRATCSRLKPLASREPSLNQTSVGRSFSMTGPPGPWPKASSIRAAIALTFKTKAPARCRVALHPVVRGQDQSPLALAHLTIHEVGEYREVRVLDLQRVGQLDPVGAEHMAHRVDGLVVDEQQVGDIVGAEALALHHLLDDRGLPGRSGGRVEPAVQRLDVVIAPLAVVLAVLPVELLLRSGEDLVEVGIVHVAREAVPPEPSSR